MSYSGRKKNGQYRGQSVDQVVSYSCSRLSTSFDRDVEYDPFGGRRYSLEILKWIEFGELCYIKNPSTFRQLLQVCKNVRQSLAILDRIVFLYEDQHRPGGQKLDKEKHRQAWRNASRVFNFYMENGPDINNPPPRFLHILKDFRQMGAIQTIGSALSSLGLGLKVVMICWRVSSTAAWSISSTTLASLVFLGQIF